MGPKKAEKRSERGKEHVDRQEQSKYKFDHLHLEVKYPGTAILLLKCQEQPGLLAAAAALSKYGSKAKENLEVLFDLDIVESVIPLIEHEDLFIRRFAAKLLAEMILIPNVRNFLLETTYYISYFANVLMSDKDVFMQEFSSWILAEISGDLFGAAQLLKVCPRLNFLFEKFQSPDPDVKRNNLQILLNLLQDPVGSNEVLQTKDFNLNLIYDLYNSSYVEIQRLALNITADIVGRNQDERLQELFRRSNGLQALLKFLDNDEWQDLHAEVLRILCSASDNTATVELLHDIGGIRQILKYKEDIAHSKLFIEALDVAVRLARTHLGRKALYAHGIVNHLLNTFEGNMPESVYEIGCHGIGMMTLHPEAAKELIASSCMKNILDILKNESLKWSTRQAAMFALNQLLKCNGKNGQDFLNMQGQNYLVWLMRQPVLKVPVEILNGAIECLTTIGRSQSLRSAIITADVMDALCASFKLTCPATTDYKIACCNALSTLCVDQLGRSVFLKVHGPNRLYNLLCDVGSVPTRNAATQTIQLLCADPVLANAFVQARYLNYMLKNRTTARIVPSWDTCIEALFDAHLPIKFAFTGRLSLHDVTENGFYVLRRNICPFPILDDIFRFSICPLEPVYVVNCVRSYLPESQERLRHSIGDGTVVGSNRASIRVTVFYLTEDLSVENGDKVIRPRIFLSTQIEGLGEDQKFSGLQCDICLHNYVELFKCKLDAAETKRVYASPVIRYSSLVYYILR
nr:armadillo repeat-containing protein 3-like [Megalopta genalis]